MKRLLALAAMLLWPGLAAAQEARGEGPMPQPLEELSRPVRSGDWLLQCESSQVCRITGVVKTMRRGEAARALVTISRGLGPNARWALRMAFFDDYGFVLKDPPLAARLHARGTARPRRPLDLALTPDGGERGYPRFRTDSDQAWRIVEALRRWPRAVIRLEDKTIARLPRGNLARLIRRMDALQAPLGSRLTAAESSRWLQEYHYRVVRARPAERGSPPDDVLLSCDTQTHVNGIEGWEVDSRHMLWIVTCPEGSKLFVQEWDDKADQGNGRFGEAREFFVKENDGTRRQSQWADFLPEKSLLELKLSRQRRGDCGLRLQFGYTDKGNFAMIEDRRMPLCRGIPSAYWPMVWAPTSWKLVDR